MHCLFSIMASAEKGHIFCKQYLIFSNFLLLLEERLSHSFILALTDCCICEQECTLLALPVWLGGLGIRVLVMMNLLLL